MTDMTQTIPVTTHYEICLFCLIEYGWSSHINMYIILFWLTNYAKRIFISTREVITIIRNMTSRWIGRVSKISCFPPRARLELWTDCQAINKQPWCNISDSYVEKPACTTDDINHLCSASGNFGIQSLNLASVYSKLLYTKWAVLIFHIFLTFMLKYPRSL